MSARKCNKCAHITFGIKQCLHLHVGCVWHYSAASFPLACPSPSPLLMQQPRAPDVWSGTAGLRQPSLPHFRDCQGYCLQTTVCTAILDVRCHPDSWPGSGNFVRYRDTYSIATLHWLVIGLRHSHKFVGLVSECGCRLCGLHCLLRTPVKSEVGVFHLVHRRSRQYIYSLVSASVRATVSETALQCTQSLDKIQGKSFSCREFFYSMWNH